MPATLAATEVDVTEFLRPIQNRLKAAGYSHTAVPDLEITVFNSNCAQIRVILSRRRADGSEIERFFVTHQVTLAAGMCIEGRTFRHSLRRALRRPFFPRIHGNDFENRHPFPR
jgi:hypothetical protein